MHAAILYMGQRMHVREMRADRRVLVATARISHGTKGVLGAVLVWIYKINRCKMSFSADFTWDKGNFSRGAAAFTWDKGCTLWEGAVRRRRRDLHMGQRMHALGASVDV